MPWDARRWHGPAESSSLTAQVGDSSHSVAVEASLLILRDPFKKPWSPAHPYSSDNLTPASNQSPLARIAAKEAENARSPPAEQGQENEGGPKQRLPASSWKAMSAMAGGTAGGALASSPTARRLQVARPTVPYQHQVSECPSQGEDCPSRSPTM